MDGLAFGACLVLATIFAFLAWQRPFLMLVGALTRLADAYEKAAEIDERATRYAAKLGAGFVRRKPEKLPEPTEAEQFVAAFREGAGAALTEEQLLEVEWAYGRLRGQDPDQGSQDDAREILRKYRAPFPPGVPAA